MGSIGKDFFHKTCYVNFLISETNNNKNGSVLLKLGKNIYNTRKRDQIRQYLGTA